MPVAKIFGAFLMTLILGMSFGAINTAEAKTPGRHTMKCPGPANWRLPSHLSAKYQKSGSSCIKKGTKKATGVGAYQWCAAMKYCKKPSKKRAPSSFVYTKQAGMQTSMAVPYT